MVKIPKRPEEIFEPLTNDYKELFGEDLISIILYGSGARGDYIPKRSDLNFLILLTEDGIEMLHIAFKTVAKWHRYRVSTPLFLTKSYIESSLDTFPIEFLNIKHSYKLLWGEDILRDLTFEPRFIRLQCERELKGKLLYLREHFLETQGKTKLLEELIIRSLPTFFSLFNAIIFLLRKEIPKSKKEAIEIIAKDTGVNAKLFYQLLNIKEGREKLSSNKAIDLFESYIQQIRNLSRFVDTMQIKEDKRDE